MSGSIWEHSLLVVTPVIGAAYSSSLECFLMPGDFILFDKQHSNNDEDLTDMNK